MGESLFLAQAKRLINSVRGKPVPAEQLKTQAVELAALLLQEAKRQEKPREQRIQKQLARMMNDPQGKAFTAFMTDQCFRSSDPARVADQLCYLIKQLGVPKFLSPFARLQIACFKFLGPLLPSLFIPLTKRLLRREMSNVILPGEPAPLARHIKARERAGIRVNLNHLGEAILGEEEAKERLQVYLDDLAKPEVDYISIKVSTIYSQIHLLPWEETLNILASRLRLLYRAAIAHPFRTRDGRSISKFVNLDMEEYRDLYLTVALFCRVLEEPEFHQLEAGIVLQAYLPDSSELQRNLTEWALRRIAAGGAPIKIRLVKGANLAMEQVDAALHDWPQAPYTSKEEVDANYKRMVRYGLTKQHTSAVRIGIASHNLFDIAYALLLRASHEVEANVCFEMLEGMAEPIRRVVQTLSGDMLLYCPAARKEEFQNAVAYLIRRLDENTAPMNFLRHAFELKVGSPVWESQAALFLQACARAEEVSNEPRRVQDRTQPPEKSLPLEAAFENEPDTDWTIPANRRWIQERIHRWLTHKIAPIPLMIEGKEWTTTPLTDSTVAAPSSLEPLYQSSSASTLQVEQALRCAKEAERDWAAVSTKERALLLLNIAQVMRAYRGDLIGAMVISCSKTAQEADVEVSEAIDFAEYYAKNRLELDQLEDIAWKPKGTVLVAPPWNFPASIPAGGILAALAAGNCVLFKPANEALLVGWLLAQLFWEAGVSKKVLQFLTGKDETVGSALVRDPRVNAVILTGATATAKQLLKLRPGLDLLAETGGKNSMIITSMADRDLAVRDLVHSAFSHAGQKCSACSLAILEAEVYDDPQFRKQLRDAAASYTVGLPWNLQTKVPPLIRAPGAELKRALTTLEPGEEWLLEPQENSQHPFLWSPGIKLGVQPGSFTHLTEFFGPLLGLMRARDLKEAIELANAVPYGLTSGIHTLDLREQEQWTRQIQAGNCYINRTITGAIVQRQPFGGCKESSFGRGAKAGGPNYLTQLMQAQQRALPAHLDESNEAVLRLDSLVRRKGYDTEQLVLWKRSLGSYAYYWSAYFSHQHDPSLIQGQDNLFSYLPYPLTLRLQRQDRTLDLFRVCAAALTCGTPLEISGEAEALESLFGRERDFPVKFVAESEPEFISRLAKESQPRLRLLSAPSLQLQTALANISARVLPAPVLANGRLELLNYLREVALSSDYHRYGNLGLREGEPRTPLVSPTKCHPIASPCKGCQCK